MSDLDVYNYDNFRRFLLDYYNEQKQTNPHSFSYRYLNKAAGFNTSNFLHQVIKGKRNLSKKSVKQVARAIKLKGKKINYFENLVFFNQASDVDEKTVYFDKLIKLKEHQVTRVLDPSQMVYFSKWYFPVVREMIKWPSFQPKPEWIATHIKPNIKVECAKLALQTLLKLGLARINADGIWEQSEPHVKSQDQGEGASILNFHQNMIQLGYRSLSDKASNRDISAMTVSLSPHKFNLLRKKMLDFQEEIRSFINQPLTEEGNNTSQAKEAKEGKEAQQHETSKVCQINFQLFTLASGIEENEK